MIKDRLNRLISRGAELAVTVILVLVFFLQLIGLLVVIFPKGTSLGNLMQSGNLAELRERNGMIEMNLPEEDGPVATLSLTRGRVQDKPAEEIAWETSRSGMGLKDRHAVQTADGSRARISYDEEHQIDLGENTLVVVRALDDVPARSTRKAPVVILDGHLSVRLAGDQLKPMEVEVQTAGARATFAAEKPGEQADFDVVTNDDQSSTISVYSGRARVEAQNRTVNLVANQALNIATTGETGPILDLPPPPHLINASRQAVYRYRAQPPRVRFRWDGPGRQDAYLFTLAKDPDFADVVRETRVTGAEFTHGNLREGQYFWRVQSLRGDLKGAPSEAGRVRLVSDAEPPVLSVSFPGEEVAADSILLTGSVEKGTDLFIGNEQVAVDETGSFKHQVRLERGLNVVVLQAVDPVGNTTYESRKIRAMFQD